MKLVNNNLSPIPFYEDLSMQNHRKDYAFGSVFPLVIYRNMLLPFQVILPVGLSILNVRLIDFNTKKVVDILDEIVDAGLMIDVSYAEKHFSLLKYPGILPLPSIKYEGLYYLEIELLGFNSASTIYSDIFCVKNTVDDMLLIEYRNSYNFELKNGVVDFSSNFGFKCYLHTQVGKPEYVFEEEANSRMGYSFIETQVSKKVYKFTFLAPEYLCDALRIVRLCDNKKITSKNQVYDLTSFSMEPDWEEQGDLAAVECEFETDTVIANIGGYNPKLLGGDFNNDFNDDYKVT